MADPTTDRGAASDVPPRPRPITALIRSGMLDAETAATVWLLIEGRVPLLVAADDGAAEDARTLLAAALDFVPTGVRRIELAGDAETFDWLPQAAELGWRRPGDHVGAVPSGTPPVRPETAILVVPALSSAGPASTWGEPARIAVRAATIGYGMAGTIVADSLEAVLTALRRPPVGLTDDEVSRLGVVLVLGRRGEMDADGGPVRVVAAHYIRPVARDEHGHVQRLGPAVLATWDEGAGRFEHFGWGITPELARRVGRRAGDFETELDRRRDLLAGLADLDADDPERVRSAIAAQALTTGTDQDPSAARDATPVSPSARSH